MACLNAEAARLTAEMTYLKRRDDLAELGVDLTELRDDVAVRRGNVAPHGFGRYGPRIFRFRLQRQRDRLRN